MARFDDVRAWAREVALDGPIRWDAVEQRVLAMPMPDPEPLPDHLATPEQLERRVAVMVGILRVLAGLALVAMPVSFRLAVSAQTGGRDGWWTLVVLSVITAAVVVLSAFATTRDVRPGAWWFLGCGGALVSAAFTLVLAWPVWPGLLHFVLIAIVLASFATLVLLARRRSLPPPTPQWVPTPEEAVRLDARAAALRTLVRRGAGAGVDEKALNAMPLGTWHTLDR